MEICRDDLGARALPFACTGDFDGDGRTDAALLLVGPRRRYLVAAFRQRPDGSFGAWRLTSGGDEDYEDASGKLALYIGREPRGMVGYVVADGDDLRPATMRLAHDGIAVIWVNIAAQLFYVCRDRYRRVWTAD